MAVAVYVATVEVAAGRAYFDVESTEVQLGALLAVK